MTDFFTSYAWAQSTNKWAMCFLYVSATLTIAGLIFNQSVSPIWVYVSRINVAVIIIYNILIVISAYLSFTSRTEKMADMIDNGFGTKLAWQNSKGYYDNDSVQEGWPKFALNAYESCYFSYKILSSMWWQLMIKNIIIFIIFLIAMIAGATNLLLFLANLSIIIHIIRKFIISWIVKNELSMLNANYRNLFFQQPKIKTLQTKSLYYLLRYETAMVWLNSVLSFKKYKAMNHRLTIEWGQIRDDINRQNKYITL